ncbi:hypothetical protein [Nitrosomonas sp.]|uniref:hypothetical protein n=1 Tax=Nitrosomonas sp. TaxID=42353 RepID=UPI001D8A1911|nr:hypothetical protein [Nitrosomonas sp.]MBX3617111.1 hypothetical protein [Nitrosomonas sp.]
MSKEKFIAVFAIVGGLVIPLIFKILALVIPIFPLTLLYTMLVVYPSSIFLLVPSSGESFFSLAFIIAAILNLLLYTLIGTAIWLGLFMKKYWIAGILGVVMSYLWWTLLTL